MASFVAYYRVSTSGQGKSGLGLDAQREAVRRYVDSVDGKLVAEFQEIESGAVGGRPQLQEALRYCRSKKAMLVIAKLDRLARSVFFITQLMESGVEFVAADMPTANKLTIHIIAAMAEYERDAISLRTKESLRAAKIRGVPLGNPNIKLLSAAGVAGNKAKADEYARGIIPVIEHLRANGITSHSRLAAALEARGVRTQRGGGWTAAGVSNLIRRINSLKGR